jgi:hypothetical protein
MARKSKTKDKEKEREKERPERSERSERPDRPKPRNDAYVTMLVITFFAIVTGCVLLYRDNEQYGSKQPPKEVIPALADLGGGKPTDTKQ